METSDLQTLKGSAKQWYLLLILGLIFIAMGIWVFFTPVSSFVALSLFFSFLSHHIVIKFLSVFDW